jgi:hypothetical protein
VAEYVFWVALALVTYAYLGYPMLIAILARRVSDRSRSAHHPPVMYSHNRPREGANDRGRIDNAWRSTTQRIY